MLRMWCSLTNWNKSHQIKSWFVFPQSLPSNMSNYSVGSTCCFCLSSASSAASCLYCPHLPCLLTPTVIVQARPPVNRPHLLSPVSKLASVSFSSHIQCHFGVQLFFSGRLVDWTVALWLQSANRAMATWATVHTCFLKASEVTTKDSYSKAELNVQYIKQQLVFLLPPSFEASLQVWYKVKRTHWWHLGVKSCTCFPPTTKPVLLLMQSLLLLCYSTRYPSEPAHVTKCKYD